MKKTIDCVVLDVVTNVSNRVHKILTDKGNYLLPFVSQFVAENMTKKHFEITIMDDYIVGTRYIKDKTPEKVGESAPEKVSEKVGESEPEKVSETGAEKAPDSND